METDIKYCLRTLLLTLLVLNAVFEAIGQGGFNYVRMAAQENGFQSVPDTIQTSVYWYWMSDNISEEGVIKDLEAMKKVGINRAFIGNIGYPLIPYGKVKLFSEEWWKILHAALKKAAELNIEIGVFNSPGWSQSGGPWIGVDHSMRYLNMVEMEIKGPGKLYKKIGKPANEFQDVKLIAYPKPKNYNEDISFYNPKIYSDGLLNANLLFDRHFENEFQIPKEGISVNIDVQNEFTLRSITLFPAKRPMKIYGELQVEEGGQYKTIKEFMFDRSNDELIVGFAPYSPGSLSVQTTSSRKFRLRFKNCSPGASLVEVQLSSSPKIENYIEKTLAKMYQTPFPLWKEYQWAVQPEVEDASCLINPKQVLDISSFMNEAGELEWDVPYGDWIVLRTGMTPTGVKNNPASPEGKGYETDKLSKRSIQYHFDAFIGQILKRIPPADRKTWKVVVADSYETGGQNWTPDMITYFKKEYGYDPVPFIPAIKGMVVGSQQLSDRFLWDLRRLIADKVAFNYVGGLRERCHEYGLNTWLENYGHWGFPGEFLQYGGQSDEIAGEFWNEGELGNIENKAASSAAHIYGITKVSAESFTAGGKAFARYPALMKQKADRFFTEGINNTLLHVYIHQPDDKLVPGINADFGSEFNRNNTWFNLVGGFVKYLKRCNFMLQQGKYVADVAYFIGEDAPKMTGVCDPALPQGYSYDYINRDILLEQATVNEGRVTLNSGMSYRVLILPKLETMTPRLLSKIEELVKDGAIVFGNAPKRSPSLENYPDADRQVNEISSRLWRSKGATDHENIHAYGKGKVIDSSSLEEVFKQLEIIPDCSFDKDSVLFIHRKLTDGEVYFVSNQRDQEIAVNASFRVVRKVPELWDPLDGSIRKLPVFVQTDDYTTIPLQLPAHGSFFIIFRSVGLSKKNSAITAENFPVPLASVAVKTGWQVRFNGGMEGLQDKRVFFDTLVTWDKRFENDIKYYSGPADYANSFRLFKLKKEQRVLLDVGNMAGIAKILINGKDAGTVWSQPFSLDITPYVKPGNNHLKILYANTWVNHLIGMQRHITSPINTSITVNPYTAQSSLEESGLRGPVLVKIIAYE